MKSRLTKKTDLVLPVSIGTFAKRDLPTLTGRGIWHVHSSPLGEKDPLVQLTLQATQKGEVASYPWEAQQAATLYRVSESRHRTGVIEQIGQEKNLSRYFKERVTTVLEELISNAIYHSYKGADGKDKYRRKDSVILADKEAVEVRALVSDEGIFLSVRDKGGSLRPEDLQRVFARCYDNFGAQIEGKEGGAGLGLYMVFEQCTHVKITSQPGVEMEVTVWIARRSNFDPCVFSFNFFRRR